MLTIEQFRMLWQILAALVCDQNVVREIPNVSKADIFNLMRYCEKVLEEN